MSKRADSAAATGQRVLDAARALFLRADFHEVSIDVIAKRAGVARTTVFQQFGSKKKLLRAIVLDVARRAGVENLMRRLDDPDAIAALHVAFEVGCEVWERERAMYRRLASLAVVDADVRAVEAEKDAGRQKRVDILARQLHRQGCLKVPLAAARDLLSLLTSFGTFDTLYAERRSAAQVAALLMELTHAFVREK